MVREFLDDQVRAAVELAEEGTTPLIDGALDPVTGRAALVGISNPEAFAVMLETYLTERFERQNQMIRDVVERDYRRMRSPGWRARAQREIEEGAAILRGMSPVRDAEAESRGEVAP